ncbi:NAD-dependent epimerase/dehydratase family protein [Roseovarius indicus]|uniref:NAD-dependent epimerase/dehydratase family protein n=1 Tax=Roseovarius indicus TaxID=540747 RepID=UPI0007D90407|nr:NAD-dependent epimerase/dehydratase family protein [Roseovarius indicus]OAO07153.1 hypothetical protein A8B76_02295 [Roseovarius indicus]
MKMWIVTGGAGFIGSHLVRALLCAGHEVTVIDNFSTGRRENLSGISAWHGLTVIDGDAGDPQVLRRAMRATPDGIFHLAATVQVQDCIRDWLGSHRANATMTLTLMSEASQNGAVPVVYASSAAVYGDRSDEICHEDLAERPLSPYGADKLACEHHARAFEAIHGLPSAGLRFFNVYGPRQRADSAYAGVLARFISDAENGTLHTIFGDGEQTRDFIHVSDVVQVMSRAMDLIVTERRAHIVNVCTGVSTSVTEAAQLIDRIAGHSIACKHAPARRGEIRHSRGSTALMGHLLGQRDFLGLEEGLLPMLATTATQRIA